VNVLALLALDEVFNFYQ